MKRIQQRSAFPYLLISPGLILLAITLAFPIFWGLYLSFNELNLARLGGPIFVGLSNYVDLFSNPDFMSALWNTLYFVFASIFLEFVFGIAIAQLLNHHFFGRNYVRGLFLLPWMVTPVVVGFNWAWLLNESYGIINFLLIRMGIVSKSINWLSSPKLALPVIILVDVWRETPFVMLVLLAGLQSIPGQLYETAKIDGAGAWKRFWYVTLPLLKPAIAVALLMRTMIALRFFDIVWIMTRGGPAGSTEILGTYAYKKAFLGFRMGYGSAVSFVIFLLSLMISLGYIQFLHKRGEL